MVIFTNRFKCLNFQNINLIYHFKIISCRLYPYECDKYRILVKICHLKLTTTADDEMTVKVG